MTKHLALKSCRSEFEEDRHLERFEHWPESCCQTAMAIITQQGWNALCPFSAFPVQIVGNAD